MKLKTVFGLITTAAMLVILPFVILYNKLNGIGF